MSVELVTTKITPKALADLRLASVLSDEKHYETIERLLAAEVARLTPKLAGRKPHDTASKSRGRRV